MGRRGQSFRETQRQVDELKVRRQEFINVPLVTSYGVTIQHELGTIPKKVVGVEAGVSISSGFTWYRNVHVINAGPESVTIRATANAVFNITLEA